MYGKQAPGRLAALLWGLWEAQGLWNFRDNSIGEWQTWLSPAAGIEAPWLRGGYVEGMAVPTAGPSLSGAVAVFFPEYI